MSPKLERNVSREHVWARGFFMGPTGSGKSRAALELASKISGGAPVTLINTERQRGKLYADRFTYDLFDMSGDDGEEVDFSPVSFVRAIDEIEGATPGGTIIVDSGSHEWMGKNGVLAQADRFGDWKTVRPMHNDFVDRLMAVRGHVIVCVRAKMKYEVAEEEVNGRKKQSINMLGVGPIQSDDMQYEFNLVARFDQTTKEATFSGHVEQLQGTIADLFDATDVAEKLSQWLSEGSPPVEPEAATDEAVAALVATLKEEGHKDATIEEQFGSHRGKHRGVLDPEWVADQMKKSADRIAAKKAAEPKTEPAAAA